MMDCPPATGSDLDTRHEHTTWHHTAIVPVRLFGLPRQHTHLSQQAPDLVVEAATNAFTHFHATQCRPCAALQPLHSVLHPLRARALLIGAVAVVAIIAAATVERNTQAQLLSVAILGTTVGTILIHTAWILCAIAAAIHRRRMPEELALRAHHALLRMMRPHS